MAPGTRLEGRAGLRSIIEQLGGLELPAGEWERTVLPARLTSYDPRWLDELCLVGEVSWGRLTPRHLEGDEASPRRSRPSRTTPMALFPRDDLELWIDAVRRGERPAVPEVGAAAELHEVLIERGASFRSDLPGLTGRLPSEVDEGLLDLVARGLVTADGFGALRALLSPAERFARRQRASRGSSRYARRAPAGTGGSEGRWALLAPGAAPVLDRVASEELAEAVARRLLDRWGILVWELTGRESLRVPWREVSAALRRLEARGEVLGGRFVAGLSGEQFALPESLELLERVERSDDQASVTLAATDPLNLSGILLPGPRIPAVRRRSVRVVDGAILDAG